MNAREHLEKNLGKDSVRATEEAESKKKQRALLEDWFNVEILPIIEELNDILAPFYKEKETAYERDMSFIKKAFYTPKNAPPFTFQFEEIDYGGGIKLQENTSEMGVRIDYRLPEGTGEKYKLNDRISNVFRIHLAAAGVGDAVRIDAGKCGIYGAYDPYNGYSGTALKMAKKKEHIHKGLVELCSPILKEIASTPGLETAQYPKEPQKKFKGRIEEPKKDDGLGPFFP